MVSGTDRAPDNQRQEPSHRLRDKGSQDIGHMVHNLALLQYAEEYACSQNRGCHHKSQTGMRLNNFILKFSAGIIHQQRCDTASINVK